VARLEMLGYRDSGMIGTEANDDPACFWRADVDEAADRLARILDEENPDAFTCYDEHGGYGHPDHVQVHTVGLKAAAATGVPRIFMATINRDHVKAMITLAREAGIDPGFDGEEGGDAGPDFDTIGVEEERITTAVDVSAYLGQKRASMEAHPSQIQQEGFPLGMPDFAFDMAFGREWYVRIGAVREGEFEDSLLA